MAIKKLKPQGIKYLKIIHLITACMWIGGGIALIVILCFIRPTTPEGYYVRSLSAKLIDDFIIIPGAVGLFITAVIYSIWSNWGFFKYRWITVKWIMIIVQTILGTAIGLLWVNTNIFVPEDMNNYIVMRETVANNVLQTIIWGTVQTVCLLVVIWISVVKPWKKKKSNEQP